ncbi:hypothetical protein ACTA71_005048 [Dictyostelium dimigraforme]
MIKKDSILLNIIERKDILNLNENYNDVNFFKIWKNNYLKQKIIYYLKISNQLYRSIFFNCNDFIKVENKEFIKHLIIGFNDPLKNYFNKLPNSITTLELGGKFNQQIRENQLPSSSITTLVFGEDFNQSIRKKNIIPSSVTKLIFRRSYNKPFSSESLPCSIKTIKFGDSFNQEIKCGDIPSSITDLSFGYSFNNSLNNLPISIEHLSILHCFNRRIELGNCLSLTELKFDKYNKFNQVIEPGDLPISLKRLTLGDSFNQKLIIGSLPPQLEYLSFGLEFNQPLSDDDDGGGGVLPNSIQTLYFGNKFSQPLKPNCLPKSLKKLVGIGNLKLESENVLNKLNLLTELDLGNYDHPIDNNFLPPNLKSLNLGILNQCLIKGSLPNSITFLDMGLFYNHRIDVGILPTSLNHLILSKQFNKPLDDDNGVESIPFNCSILEFPFLKSTLAIGKHIIIPSNIIKLKISLPNNDSMQIGSVPSTIKDLFLDRSLFKQIPINMIPTSVTTLHIDFYSYNLFPGLIPNSVLNLSFGFYNQPLFENSIPSSVINLNLGRYFNHNISSNNIPSSIRSLKLGLNFNSLIGDLYHITHLSLPIGCKYKLKELKLPNLISVSFL